MNLDPSRDPNQPPDPARARYMVLTVMRLSGVALILLGLAGINGKLGLPVIAGYAFLFAGILDALVMPVVLARAWKSPS